MLRWFLAHLILAAFFVIALAGLSPSRAGLNSQFMSDVKKLLPSGTYKGVWNHGGVCTIEVRNYNRDGIPVYEALGWVGNEKSKAFRFVFSDNEREHKVVRFDHDYGKQHFLKFEALNLGIGSSETKKMSLIVILSRGKLGSIIIKEGIWPSADEIDCLISH